MNEQKSGQSDKQSSEKLNEKSNEQFLFPYSNMRDEQDKLIRDIDSALRNKKSFLGHAPTGLGKTVSALGPALNIALEKNLKVFFITPRHTQHKIVLETVRAIEKKYNKNIVVADFIGKKWMCAHDNVTSMTSGQFADFCTKKVEDGQCEFYNNVKEENSKITVPARALISNLLKGLHSNEEIFSLAKEEKMCPYEISSLIAQKAKLIIGDYYHIIHPEIRQRFMKRCNAEIENSIIIIDEAHNVASRVRELMSTSLSNYILGAAIKEANLFLVERDKSNENKNNNEKYVGFDNVIRILNHIDNMMKKFESRTNDEIKIKKEEVVDFIKSKFDYNEVIAQFKFASDLILEDKKQSFIGLIGNFLQQWDGGDYGFIRLAKREGKKFSLQYNCLDPSLITSNLIENSYSTIAVSGTLEPTEMYANILGFPKSVSQRSYKNPFKQSNRLNMIIPQTSTKYTTRDDKMYKQIAEILSKIVNMVPGNCALFFPSYSLRDEIDKYLNSLCRKTTFSEQPNTTKLEKEEFIERFKSYKDEGAVLMGVVSGSFSEGIDLPGDLLKCVVIVGIPLSKPDLETQELISYYDVKFGKGWDYGYLLPAMSKVLQGAGRCIRSETDRGVIIFLDERFTWQNYYKSFPKDWDIKITGLYEDRIKEFFKISK